MEIDLHEKAINDFKYWQKSGNKAVKNKIQQLFTDMQKHPFESNSL